MPEMHSEERILHDMFEPVSKEEYVQVKEVTLAWANAVEAFENPPSVRIVFLTCLNAIQAMGPAYCRVAAAHLLNVDIQHSRENTTKVN